METKATLRFLHMSPKKVRLVADMVRGVPVTAAENQLHAVNKAASKPLLKLLNSITANAIHNFDMKRDNLYIKEIRVDGAGMLKRWRPRAHGRATMIQNKMSHISITVAEIDPTPEKNISKKKTAEIKPIKVSSKDEIKEALDPKKADEINPSKSEQKEDHDEEVHDVRMEGKHRHQQNQDSRSKKGIGGVKKKLFNRKAG